METIPARDQVKVVFDVHLPISSTLSSPVRSGVTAFEELFIDSAPTSPTKLSAKFENEPTDLSAVRAEGDWVEEEVSDWEWPEVRWALESTQNL
jgi:hypothetical protein